MTIKTDLEARKIEICKAFNKKPSAGIDIIKEICGDDESLHSHIAFFFITNKANLDPAAIGDYLSTYGGKKKENEKVLSYFMEQMNFQGKSFTDALRENLKAFKLPGEAQKIDRLINGCFWEAVY